MRNRIELRRCGKQEAEYQHNMNNKKLLFLIKVLKGCSWLQPQMNSNEAGRKKQETHGTMYLIYIVRILRIFKFMFLLEVVKFFNMTQEHTTETMSWM